MTLQVFLGLATHYIRRSGSKMKERTGRDFLNYTHWFVGLTTMAVGWATVYYGKVSL